MAWLDQLSTIEDRSHVLGYESGIFKLSRTPRGLPDTPLTPCEEVEDEEGAI